MYIVNCVRACVRVCVKWSVSNFLVCPLSDSLPLPTRCLALHQLGTIVATRLRSDGKGLQQLTDIVNVMLASAAFENEAVATAAIDVLSMWSTLAPALTALDPSVTSSVVQVSPSHPTQCYDCWHLPLPLPCRACVELLAASVK